MPQPMPTTPRIPGRLNHVAYVMRDAAETCSFYRGVLGLPLVEFVIDDKVPSTGDEFPYAHLFFELGDGSSVAFFESLGLPAPSPSTHPAYDIFNHLALDVGEPKYVDLWADHLRSHGVEVLGPVDHGVIYSIYFHDPNGVRLELTANQSWTPDAEASEKALLEWTAAKQASQQRNDLAPLRELIAKRRAMHKHKGVPASVALDAAEEHT